MLRRHLDRAVCGRSEATRSVLAFGWEMGHVAARRGRHGHGVRWRRRASRLSHEAHEARATKFTKILGHEGHDDHEGIFVTIVNPAAVEAMVTMRGGGAEKIGRVVWMPSNDSRNHFERFKITRAPVDVFSGGKPFPQCGAMIGRVPRRAVCHLSMTCLDAVVV